MHTFKYGIVVLNISVDIVVFGDETEMLPTIFWFKLNPTPIQTGIFGVRSETKECS